MNLFSDIVLLMLQRVQTRVIMGLYIVESTSIGLTPTLLSMLNFCLTLRCQEVFIFIPWQAMMPFSSRSRSSIWRKIQTLKVSWTSFLMVERSLVICQATYAPRVIRTLKSANFVLKTLFHFVLFYPRPSHLDKQEKKIYAYVFSIVECLKSTVFNVFMEKGIKRGIKSAGRSADHNNIVFRPYLWNISTLDPKHPLVSYLVQPTLMYYNWSGLYTLNI